MLNKSGESMHFVLFLILEDKFKLFAIEYEVSCGLVISVFIMLRHIPSTLTLFNIFFNHLSFIYLLLFFTLLWQNQYNIV